MDGTSLSPGMEVAAAVAPASWGEG
jgi:hypothetical protein